MTAGTELMNIKKNLLFDCKNIDDLKSLILIVAQKIMSIAENYPANDHFFQTYIDLMILNNMQSVNNFIGQLNDVQEKKLEFLSKSLKYHFNCVIDSYSFVCIAMQLDEKSTPYQNLLT